MRVALLISGYLRSFRLNYPSLLENVIKKFNKIDTYIHITQNEQVDDKYLNTAEEISYINETLKPICLLQEPNLFDRENAAANLWGKYYKLNSIKKLNESFKGKYDLVIKYRPDTNLKNFNFNLSPGEITLPQKTLVDKAKLTRFQDKSLCDIFAYGNSELMDRYFDIYNHLAYLSRERGQVSETLLYHYLTEHNIPYNLQDIDYTVVLSLCNVIAICGDSASGKTTLSELLKKFFASSFVLEGDRYHKWERGDSKWSNITHLNPEANYLTKMSDDIFDLKIGKAAYQVDYNHKTGEFTEKEKLENSDNIIVCGLHSLYAPNHEVYNLKVFMDTDIRLRTQWKIDRDTIHRGKTAEQVTEQIESRKIDNEKFIAPQKEQSDLTVQFYPSDAGISLRLLINNKYKLFTVLSELTKKGVDFTMKVDGKFYHINFNSYTRCNLFDKEELNTYSFYDYIVFFILSLSK